jgi:hypothetical protein
LQGVKRRCEKSPGGASVIWVDGDVDDENRIVILYRESAGEPIVGWVRPSRQLADSYESTNPDDSAGMIFGAEITDPVDLRQDEPNAWLVDRFASVDDTIFWDIREQ